MPAPTYVRLVAPTSVPAAAGEIGLVTGILTYHNGTTTVPISGGNPIVSGEFDITANRSGVPARTGWFDISDASFAVGEQLYIQHSGEAISTKGTRTDENEMDHVDARGVVTGVGTARVYWSSDTFVKGKFRFNYRSN